MSDLGFWAKLKKPIFCLAPMADVTDCAFRQIITKYGKPDIFWTEFVSADGLAHPQAREKLLIDLKFSKKEHPIVAQIFGGKPENIRIASVLCKELGFDGIDINMGCPDKSVEKQCAGAALMKNPKLAREIIRAAKEGGQDLPVSVKTRIGYSKNEIETWVRELLSENLAALTIHLRTRKENSDALAHWGVMKRIMEIRDEMGKETLIIGNGDVVDIDDAKRKIKESSCDGVMFGRAIFGNPWLFRGIASGEHGYFSTEKFLVLAPSRSQVSPKATPLQIPSLEQKLKVLVEHTKLFEKLLGKYKNFAVIKKHFKTYVNGWDGAKELRMKLMETENAKQVEKIINDFLTRRR
ncbi:MAG: tRNA-dihydrouridine synthase [Patescibacteria group bacterium]